MFKHFISLQWKSFFRSASVDKSIGLKILMGFLAVYFAVVFLGMGIGMYPLLKEIYPEKDPLKIVNSFVVIWLAAELFFRFFMQTLPVMDIKPLLTLPIKKGSVIHYVLLKSFVSFFNLLPVLVIIPFGLMCIAQGDKPVGGMIAWMAAMYCLALCVNYANFIIKKKFAANIKQFLPFVAVGLAFAALEYFEVFSISNFFGNDLNTLINKPWIVVFPLIILIGLYFWNYTFLKKKFYLDASLETKTKEAVSTELSWTRRFGDIAPFLQLDLKLIWRNKRPKTTVWLALILLGYGMIFYPNDVYHENMPGFFVFVGIFMTGIFMINFGQFIPSWDSSYYSMMMAQNIPLRKYLASKAGLMTFSVVVLFLLSTPYVYFGWKILWLNLACALYNLGLNIPCILYAGSFNKKRIDLDKSPFMNYQGTGATQWIVGLPLMLLPLGIWYLVYKFTTFNIASITLGVMGAVGLLLRGWFMEVISKSYRKNKYAMIHGFKQKGD